MSDVINKIKNSFKPQSGTLLSPAADFLMAGGASILLFLAILPFDINSFLGMNFGFWITGLYFSAFIINYPHFTSSYQLLYQDLREYFFTYKGHPFFSLQLWWAGLIVPVMLFGYFVFALSADTPYYMGFFANAMVFTVGWHYVKQIFGCTVVLSAAKQIYYSRLERYIMLVPLYLLWLVYYAAINTGTETFTYLSVPYQPLGLPTGLVNVLTYALYASVAICFITLVKKFYGSRTLPSLSAAAAFISIFIWFWPANQDNYYYVFIVPFFHSLQYLLFISAYKKNQAIELYNNPATPKAQTNFGLTALLSFIFIAIPIAIIVLVFNGQITGRLEHAVQLYIENNGIGMSEMIYAALAVMLLVTLYITIKRSLRQSVSLSYIVSFVIKVLVLGALLFSIIPVVLDTLAIYDLLPHVFDYDSALYGTTLYLFFFTVFVNIHHYFIDNVIWRRNNPKVRQYLYVHDDELFETH